MVSSTLRRSKWPRRRDQISPRNWTTPSWPFPGNAPSPAAVFKVVPETLKAANGDGWFPAHCAAKNGHEEVIQFLTLKTADGDGKFPAHLAAENGHEGVAQFLHEVVSDTPAATP